MDTELRFEAVTDPTPIPEERKFNSTNPYMLIDFLNLDEAELETRLQFGNFPFTDENRSLLRDTLLVLADQL
jgi:hypothetical protein